MTAKILCLTRGGEASYPNQDGAIAIAKETIQHRPDSLNLKRILGMDEPSEESATENVGDPAAKEVDESSE